MTSGPLGRRRRLIALTPGGYLQCRATAGGPQMLADPATLVVQVPLPPSLADNPELAELERAGELQAGGVYVRNPFNRGRFVELSQAWTEFSYAKAVAFARVCQYLGARHAKLTEIRSDSGEQSAKGEVTAGVFSTDMASRIKRRVEAFWSQEDTFKGGPVRASEAADYIEENFLSGDLTFRHLYELGADEVNRLVGQSFLLDLTREARMEFGACASFFPVLKRLTKGINFEGEYDSEKTYHISYHIQVMF